MTEGSGSRVEFLLIRSDPPCKRCGRAKQTLAEIAQARPAQVAVREITTADPEAAQYGAVLTPMVIMNGQIICAGMSPVKSGLEKLLSAELSKSS